MAKKTSSKPRVSKLKLWLKHYLDAGNPRTFLNKTESAKAAGYRATSDDSYRAIGHQNFTKLHGQIKDWLEEAGLDENTLKIKLLSLFEGQETKVVSMKGVVDPASLPENVQIIAASESVKYTKDGESYCETETLIGVNVENKELQRKALDMGFKVKGSYAPEKKEHLGKGGGVIQCETNHMLSPDLQAMFNEVTNRNSS